MAALAGAALVAFLATVIALRYVVFPQIDDYRDDIAASLSRVSGMSVSIADVDAGWHGLRPVLAMTGVRVADQRGQAVIEFERAEISLSWWTLLVGELRFRDVDVYSPHLSLRRGADGLVYLADKPLNAPDAGDVGTLVAWLLDQPGLAVHDASLAWLDELAGSPPVKLQHVEIAIRKSGRRHHAAVNATPPENLGDRLDLRADVHFSPQRGAWRVAGTLYAEARRTDFEALRSYLPIPEAIRTGKGHLRAWLDFDGGTAREVTADLDLRGVRAQLAADTRPVDLETLAGRVYYRWQEGGYVAGARDLAFRTREGLAERAANFSLSKARAADGLSSGELRAHGVDLKIAAALLDSLPVPGEAKAQVHRLGPRGRLYDSTLLWAGESLDKATSFRLKARFEDLGLNAVGRYPGATGLTGTLEGDEHGGTIGLASRSATFEAGEHFRSPLVFDALEVRARWTRQAKALEVRIEAARLANADAEVTVAGLYRALPASAEGSPGWVDLAGRVERARAPAVASYLPNEIADVRDWLGGAVLAGQLSRGRFEIKGDLAHFPFRDARQGRFHVEAAIDEGLLQYHPAWPAVERVKGEIRFEAARMEIRAVDAVIYASRASRVRAVVADLGAHPPVLEIDGEMNTTGADSVRLLRETPLAEGPGAFTRAISLEGPARLKLGLAWPLSGEGPVRVTGEYAFAGVTASAGRHLLLTGIRGPLSFTEKSVRAPELAGVMFGQPATLRLATQPDGSVLTRLDGQVGVPALGAFLPESITRRMAGTTEWKARIVSSAAQTELRVESSLKGLAVGLPEPFAKRADESRALAVTVRRLGTVNEEAVATLEGGVHARVGRREAEGRERWNVALRFGAPVATEPVREGVWLYGELARFDVDAWREALAVPAGDEMPDVLQLRGVDLRSATLRFANRDFANVSARLQRETGVWRGSLGGPSVAGEVTFDARGKGRVAARLSQFSLLAGTWGEAGPEPAPLAEKGDLPSLDIVADRFEFSGRWLGRLEMVARPEGRDWRIDRLDIGNDHALLASRGLWRRVAGGSETQLDLKLETKNLHLLLKQFGYGEFVNRGEAGLDGTLAWPGYPYEFATGALSGHLSVRASKGQFAKIEPGAGKLLGLISLQSLPRRVNFDFRDIFSEGFAFDRIAGDVSVARGTLVTKGFEVAGPSAFVSMAGEVSLPLETQSLSLRVVPEVGESVAIAATVLGTPVMGLTALVLQKLLQNPLGKVVSYEYLVTGSWDNPSVTRAGAPPPATEAAGRAPPSSLP